MGKILLVLVLSVLVVQGHSFWQRRSGTLRPPPSSLSDYAILKDAWFQQKLDHFDPENTTTWSQWYYVSDKRTDKTKRNVAFLMSSGDGPAYPTWMTNSAWADYAEEFNAVFFQLETRYYGLSRPFDNWKVENMKYLTSEQILEDMVAFIESMNKEYNFDPGVKWIAMGGFYGGTLAAWLREKRPDLVHAALTSSAPLIAAPEYSDYYSALADDLRNISQECHDAVGAAMSQLEALLKDEEGRRTATSLFKLCEPLEEFINDRKSVATFFIKLLENFGRIAENNDLGGKGGFNLKRTCDLMTDSAEPQEVKRLALLNKKLIDFDLLPCTEYKYEEYMVWYKSIETGGLGAGPERKWLWQRCNELGLFKTTSAKPHIFSNQVGLDFFVQMCIDTFGPNFNASTLEAGTKRTNRIYGALSPNVINVLFIQGSVDPWHASGVTSSSNPLAPAIFIEGTSLCSDMYRVDSEDSVALRNARRHIGETLEHWLSS